MTVYQIYKGNEIKEDIFEMEWFEGLSDSVAEKIYKGIKILYRNKVYDFSLNEGNV